MDDERYMRRAVALAERGRRTVSPNPLVGCVIVARDQVVGEGWHERAGGPHAEIVALCQAGHRASGATVYVTLEPCDHTGRTPPCTGALIAAGVRRVVIAHPDPNPLAAGGAEALRAAGVGVVDGPQRAQVAAQNRVFLHGLANRRPLVWLKTAMSLDGRVAAADGSSKWLTGVLARIRAHELRAEVDAIIVGSGTVLADDPHLTVRLGGNRDPQPLRVVLDGRARTPASAHVVDGAAPSLILVSAGADTRALSATAAGVAVVPTGADGRLDLRAVLDELWARDVRSVLVEGGPTVASGFIRSGCYDRLVVHLATLLLGDGGLPAFQDGPARLDAAERLALASAERAGDDMILTLTRAGGDG